MTKVIFWTVIRHVWPFGWLLFLGHNFSTKPNFRHGISQNPLRQQQDRKGVYHRLSHLFGIVE